MESSFHKQVIIYTILTALCWISVPGRIYVRKFIVKKMGIDDWLLIFTLIFFTVSICLSTWMAKLGLGRKDSQMRSENLPKILKLFYISGVIYLVQAVSIKLSVTFLLLRFAQSRASRLLIICTSIFCTLYGIASIFIAMFECIPINAVWNINVHGRCISRSTFKTLIYCNTTIGMITDAIFAIIPIFLIWSLPMDKKNKIGTGFVLSLGLSTSVINIVRLTFLDAFNSAGNIPYKVYPICFTSNLEIGFGIIATSLATIRPLIRRFTEQKSTSTNSTLKSRQLIDNIDLERDLETCNSHSSGGIVLGQDDAEAWAATCSAARTNASEKTDISGVSVMKRGSLSKADGDGLQ